MPLTSCGQNQPDTHFSLTWTGLRFGQCRSFASFPARFQDLRKPNVIKSAATFLMVISGVLSTDLAIRAQEFDAGKVEFQSSCASCHGMEGKGNGPFSEHLKVAPDDLTSLAKKNGGVFPLNDVYAAIYGIKNIVAHGNRDMPIWGLRYTLDSNRTFYPRPSDRAINFSYDPEAVVRTRILAIIDYLNRIQKE
jgi:mono/diheme cytochrome c family protein